MPYYEPPLIDAAAIATLWGLAALLAATPIAYVAARTSSPGALRQSLKRCAGPRWRAAP